MKAIAFLATSLDGYIADSHGSVDWLNKMSNHDKVMVDLVIFFHQ